MATATAATTNRTTETAGRESELRAAARRRELTMKELAALMGVSAGYLSQIAKRGQAVDARDAGEGRGGLGKRSPARGPSTARAAS